MPTSTTKKSMPQDFISARVISSAHPDLNPCPSLQGAAHTLTRCASQHPSFILSHRSGGSPIVIVLCTGCRRGSLRGAVWWRGCVCVMGSWGRGRGGQDLLRTAHLKQLALVQNGHHVGVGHEARLLAGNHNHRVPPLALPQTTRERKRASDSKQVQVISKGGEVHLCLSEPPHELRGLSVGHEQRGLIQHYQLPQPTQSSRDHIHHRRKHSLPVRCGCVVPVVGLRSSRRVRVRAAASATRPPTAPVAAPARRHVAAPPPHPHSHPPPCHSLHTPRKTLRREDAHVPCPCEVLCA